VLTVKTDVQKAAALCLLPRNAYVLGTVQMFVFGGGGLQLLMCL